MIVGANWTTAGRVQYSQAKLFKIWLFKMSYFSLKLRRELLLIFD